MSKQIYTTMTTLFLAFLLIYSILWIFSTFFIIVTLYYNDYDGTKKDVVVSMFIPFFYHLKIGLNKFKNLK